ncbi:MAG: thioredoxin family protein [Desulfobacterales bacterium]|nr:thioredoxin family protein [Desulfobacterales bacterium]
MKRIMTCNPLVGILGNIKTKFLSVILLKHSGIRMAFLTIAILATFIYSGCSKDDAEKKSMSKDTESSTVTAAQAIIPGNTLSETAGTKSDPEQKPKIGLPKLLDLGAKKCLPCKMMVPVLNALEREYAGVLNIEFIDVWEPKNQEKAGLYKIKSIPTQIFINPTGKELWRHTGFISKEDILTKWKELGYGLKTTGIATQQFRKTKMPASKEQEWCGCSGTP